MNKLTAHYTTSTPAIIPFTARQMRKNTGSQQVQKFTPASRNARIKSWHQRMQGLFSRQSY